MRARGGGAGEGDLPNSSRVNIASSLSLPSDLSSESVFCAPRECDEVPISRIVIESATGEVNSLYNNASVQTFLQHVIMNHHWTMQQGQHAN